jgi:hypothetical protein
MRRVGWQVRRVWVEGLGCSVVWGAGELEDSWVDEACGQQAQRDRLIALFHKASLPYPPLFSNTLIP